MNRVLLLLGAAGLIALLAWVTLKEDIAEGPRERERPRGSEPRKAVDPGVVETQREQGETAPEAQPRPKDGPLTGVVLDPSGQVLVGARVEVTIGEETVRVGETGDRGRFRFLVPPCEAAIRITTPLYPPWVKTVAAPADLGEIRLEKGFEITGRVVDESGEAVADVTVATQGLVVSKARTGEDGRFRLQGIPKVPVRVLAYGIEVRMVEEAPEVTPPAADIVLTVKRLRMGYGVVVAEDGEKPIAGATVRMTLSTGGWSQIEADESGRFGFDLTHERYSDPRLRFTVLVTAAGYEDTTISDLTLDQVRPAADLSVKLVRAVAVEPGRLRGRVLYDTGDPFHGSLTLSFSREGKAGEIFRIETNEKGEFLVPKVAPGEYVLRSAPHGESLLRETGKTLVITPGGEETTEFTLTRGGDLKISVTGPDGKAVKEAKVEIVFNDATKLRTFILPEGEGVIPDLVPGKVRVRVSKAGHETAETEVTVVKDQVTDATVRLSEAR